MKPNKYCCQFQISLLKWCRYKWSFIKIIRTCKYSFIFYIYPFYVFFPVELQVLTNSYPRIDSAMSANDVRCRVSKYWHNFYTVVCPLYLGLISILFISFKRLIIITLTNMILIVLIVVYMSHFTVLRAY